ncbi:MAG: DNA-directed RNA polymerase subunit alpha [Spirochaetaceae bacterium]|nr:DNA-directed RNA polymerase subunit alpha [Spirochaetaceae bacterium]
MAAKNLVKGFRVPKGLEYSTIEQTENYGKFEAFPFEPGFGTTIGNTLRRILLSSISGYAITAVRIERYDENGTPRFITSEFETIPGVVEDTIEILNNLKSLRVRLDESMDHAQLTYEIGGQTEITGKFFEKPGVLWVLNPETRVMTLEPDVLLMIEIQVDLGRGYVPSELNKKYIEEIGTIPMDAIFTPVTKVKYSIEPTRVKDRSDYDKLILEIWTDGTVNPEDALAQAGKIAKDYFSIFINFDESKLVSSESEDLIEEKVQQILNMPVEDMELSVRSLNCLKNANIKTVGDLTRKTEEEIAKTRNFGKKSLSEIKEKLSQWNLTLGMTDYTPLRNHLILNEKKDKSDEA